VQTQEKSKKAGKGFYVKPSLTEEKASERARDSCTHPSSSSFLHRSSSDDKTFLFSPSICPSVLQSIFPFSFCCQKNRLPCVGFTAPNLERA
jgi:hypothetical protein